ncbi:MAG: helix-turn-helix transcriptional regulator [Deferribacterota bacterium]|nr:helix-turn-helix transcriptional regulator [Deferribacterota bacterium]
MKDVPLYSISVVAEMLDLHPQTIRQYERLGLVKPKRTEGNTRLYSDSDIERLKLILTLTRDLGVNIAGVEIIIDMREQIIDLQEKLNKLVHYIKENYTASSTDNIDKECTSIVPINKKGIIKINIEKEI